VWGCGGSGGCGVLSCGVTPYVRHSTDCTCCDFGHLRFGINYKLIFRIIRKMEKNGEFFEKTFYFLVPFEVEFFGFKFFLNLFF
jgi:hypothetical protein